MVAASLLIVGPNPAAAVADRPGSGHSNNDYRKNGSGGQGGNANRAASNFVRDVVNGISGIAGIDNNSKPNLDPPKMDLGTAGSDSPQLFVVESLAQIAQGQITLSPKAG